MNTISHTELKQLAEAHGGRYVSLYLPIITSGEEMPQNHLRFKELVHDAGKLLANGGMTQKAIKDFMGPAVELLDRPLFWRTLDRGLAVFISESGIRVWHLPIECEEICVVSKRFYLLPLIAWRHWDAPFFVLAVSQNKVRLLHGSRNRMEEIKVPNLPTSLVAALHYDTREGLYQTHTGRPELHTKEGAVYTGQGGEVDVAKDELAEFCRLIDAAVYNYLHTRSEPLIYAGVELMYAIYRRHNHYPHFMQKVVSGNADLLSPLQLREQAWPFVEQVLRDKQEDAMSQYWDFVNVGKARNRLEDVVIAASEGAVETLFIDSRSRQWGAFDAQGQKVRIDDAPQSDSEDLINLAACLVLKHGGTVEPVTSGNIPGGGTMAAVLRYTSAAATG